MGEAAGRVHQAGRYVFAHGIAGSGADPAEGLREAMADLEVTLRSAGSAMHCIERITLYVRDPTQLPVDVTARSTVVQMGALRGDVQLELEATATLVDAA